MDSVQSMASSSSSIVPSAERTSHFSSQTEVEMESSKASHYSELQYSTRHSDWSAEANFSDFALLRKDPQWARFFKDFKTLVVGEKISGGAQADIYEARFRSSRDFNLVVKVMKGDAPLQALQAQWPIGMLAACSFYECSFDSPLLTMFGGTVLHDERLRGRFAFVMCRRWGDLRLLIDRRMKQERSTVGPFPIDVAIRLMFRIAEDMDTLHTKHDILHRDLKASNVLVWGGSGEDLSVIATSNTVARILLGVADFECSVGVLGTGLWRAPEILEQLKARMPCSEVQCTRASDVYSYGMTCFEIVTGCYPHDVLGGEDTISQILQGERPKICLNLPKFVRDIIVGCWHSNPLERPSFSAICKALKWKRCFDLVRGDGVRVDRLRVDIDNKSKRGASIVKVEQWNISQALTLLEVMQELLYMDLSVLKAFHSSSGELIVQSFEVTDWKGRKVVKDKCIAKIKKALSLALRMECIINKDILRTNAQMHVMEIVSERNYSLLQGLSEHLVATNFWVHSAGCWTRKGRVECVIFVEGTRMDTLLWDLRHTMDSIPARFGRFKIVVCRVADEEVSLLERRLHNLKSLDLTPPRSSSNIRVHQQKDFDVESLATKVVVCLDEWSRLVSVSRTVGYMNYKIARASVEYPGPYAVLKGRATKTQDIDVETLGEDESENMIHRIRDIATARGCREGNKQLIVSGPSEEVYDDLTISLRENDLVVTGGQVYRDGGEYATEQSFPSGDLEFFVTKKPREGSMPPNNPEDLGIFKFLSSTQF